MANLIDAFNDCVDRVIAGESIESCLNDYPEHAERLRQLLQTGELVYRAHDANVTTDAREEVRARVVQTYRTRQPRTTDWTRWLFSLSAVAALVIVVGVVALAMLGPVIGNRFSNIVNALPNSNAPTALLLVVTPTPIAFDATAKPAIEVTGTPSPAMTMTHPGTVTPPPFGTPMPTPASGEVTAVSAKPSATPQPDMLLGTVPAEAIDMSATPLIAVVTPITSDPNIVATSVVGMTPGAVTATWTPTGTATTTPTGTLAPSATFAPGTPTMPPTPAPTQQSGFQSQASATPIPLPEVIPMNAGEIDDNARWDNYLTYRSNFLQQYGYAVHDVDVTGRQIIHMTDERGLPVLGAHVQVYAGQTLVSDTLTYATGQTLFFPNARAESRNQQSYRVVVEKGSASAQFTLDPQHGPMWDVVLQNAPSLDRVRLDVLFLLDTTGSMGDELAQLQNNILGISAQIDNLPGNIDVRYGLVTYRDRGDAYVTQIYDFTPEVGVFQASLNSERADGGGDTPESVNQALHDAINSVSWRGDDTVKLVFLVADAPPHLDYPQDYDYAQEMVIAAQRGIKIHPIASSGLDQVGEYIFRQLAVHTMGHFVFLTYQQGTAGSPGIERPDLNVGTPDDPTTLQDQGDYTVERLDDLVLRLITDELSALSVRETANNPVVASKVDDSVPPVDFRPGLLIVLVGASFLVGYMVNLRKSAVVKPKRKNDERYG